MAPVKAIAATVVSFVAMSLLIVAIATRGWYLFSADYAGRGTFYGSAGLWNRCTSSSVSNLLRCTVWTDDSVADGRACPTGDSHDDKYSVLISRFRAAEAFGVLSAVSSLGLLIAAVLSLLGKLRNRPVAIALGASAFLLFIICLALFYAAANFCDKSFCELMDFSLTIPGMTMNFSCNASFSLALGVIGAVGCLVSSGLLLFFFRDEVASDSTSVAFTSM